MDCHDEHEQHSGLLTMVEQELEFPFAARVIGEEVSVVNMEWPEDSEFGLDLVVEHKGDRHRVDARSVELLEPLPDGHLFSCGVSDVEPLCLMTIGFHGSRNTQENCSVVRRKLAFFDNLEKVLEVFCSHWQSGWMFRSAVV